MDETIAGLIQQAASLIKSATYLTILTGAGLSTPSGISDFRSQRNGLWEHNDPMQVASLTAFKYQPEEFFNWLRPLARDIWKAIPNPAHLGLANLETAGIARAILTQNIDGLQQQAGAQNVIELHGSLNSFSCLKCKQHIPSTQIKKSFIDEKSIPYCNRCNSILKPDITLYEEQLPMIAWMQAEKHITKCDLIMVLGSSLEVYPVASLPSLALSHHARLIMFNYSCTHLDQQADVIIPFDVAQSVPMLCDYLFNKKSPG